MGSKAKKIFAVSMLCAFVLVVAAVALLSSLSDKKSDFDISECPATLNGTPDYGQNYVNNIVFLGDRTILDMMTQLSSDNESLSPQVWSGKDGTLSLNYNTDKATIVLPENQSEMLLTAALAEKKPRYLVITIGLENGVPYCDKDTFCDYYQKLIDAVQKSSPSTKIILQSIFPVTSKYERKHPAISNEKISECNQWICALAEQNKLRFLNTAECLADSNGNLQKDLASKDGGSLNADGYAAVIEYIRAHGYKDHPNFELPTEQITEIPTEVSTEVATEAPTEMAS